MLVAMISMAMVARRITRRSYLVITTTDYLCFEDELPPIWLVSFTRRLTNEAHDETILQAMKCEMWVRTEGAATDLETQKP